MRRLFRTDDSGALLVLRLALGIVIFPHGAQKVLGWFGGPGFAGAMGWLTQQMHVPAWLALLVLAAEFLGSLGLILGFLTRIAALGIACDMVGAVLLVHYRNGFFMNWSGQQPGEGFEFHILAVGIALALLIAGGGKASVDRTIAS